MSKKYSSVLFTSGHHAARTEEEKHAVRFLQSVFCILLDGRDLRDAIDVLLRPVECADPDYDGPMVVATGDLIDSIWTVLTGIPVSSVAERVHDSAHDGYEPETPALKDVSEARDYTIN